MLLQYNIIYYTRAGSGPHHPPLATINDLSTNAAGQERVHPGHGARVARRDYAVRVAVGPDGPGGRLGPVRERFGGRTAAVAHRAAQGREHRVRRARVPRVCRVRGQRVTFDEARGHAQQLVARARGRGHHVTGTP